MNKIEAWGSGIERIFQACAQHGCPEPQFDVQTIGLMTTLHFRPATQETGEKTTQETTQQTSEKASEKTGEKTGEKIGEKRVGKTVAAIRRAMRENPHITVAELAVELQRSSRAIEMQIAKMQQQQLVRRVGPDKGGYWEVLE